MGNFFSDILRKNKSNLDMTKIICGGGGYYVTCINAILDLKQIKRKKVQNDKNTRNNEEV